MWPYPWTHVGTPSHLGHMDRVAATMPSQAHAGAAQEAPDIGQWEGQDVPLVRPSSCNVKEGIPSSRRYLPTYLRLVGATITIVYITPKQMKIMAKCDTHHAPFLSDPQWPARHVFQAYLRACATKAGRDVRGPRTSTRRTQPSSASTPGPARASTRPPTTAARRRGSPPRQPKGEHHPPSC